MFNLRDFRKNSVNRTYYYFSTWNLPVVDGIAVQRRAIIRLQKLIRSSQWSPNRRVKLPRSDKRGHHHPLRCLLNAVTQFFPAAAVNSAHPHSIQRTPSKFNKRFSIRLEIFGKVKKISYGAVIWCQKKSILQQNNEWWVPQILSHIFRFMLLRKCNS